MSGDAGWSRTGEDIVAEIEMVVTNRLGPFLVVEGPSDECFFSRRLSDKVYVIQAGGRVNVESSIDIIDADLNHSSTLVLGIVDEDYDWLIGNAVRSANIVKFDPRDLEGMLVRSVALDAVLAEFGDREQIKNFIANEGMQVRDAVARRAEFFGRVRMFNALNQRVCLRKLKPQRFCDVRTWTYDHAAVLDEAVRLGVHSDSRQLSAALSEIDPPSIWHSVRGHDLIDILVGGLLGVLGGKSGACRNSVEMILRQAITPGELAASGLFERLSAWQNVRNCELLAS